MKRQSPDREVVPGGVLDVGRRLLRWVCRGLLAVGLLGPVAASALAQPDSGPDLSGSVVYDFEAPMFHRLPGRAGGAPVRPVPDAAAPALFAGPERPGLRMRGLEPTSYIRRSDFPASMEREFTIEMWLLDHVNRPVGVLARLVGTLFGDDGDVPLDAIMSYWQDSVRLESTEGIQGVAFDVQSLPHHARWWRHLVVTYDGSSVVLYVNGEYTRDLYIGESSLLWQGLEVGAYLANEPYMEMGDLVKSLRVYDRALRGSEVRGRFDALAEAVSIGAVVDGFHYNAGPYLQGITRTSASVVYETDRPAARVTLRVADSADVRGEGARIATAYLEGDPADPTTGGNIGELTVSGLEPGRQYFYELAAADLEGNEITSGVLTFKTAMGEGNPVRFALIGDTEARPHINRRLSELIWGERPDFLVNVGDLTDGGRQNRKFEWNHEYFMGMGALIARVPVFPVAGNGEGDLYWYSRYHALPTGGGAGGADALAINPPADAYGYYTFTWGDVQFFMLDSNRSREGFRPGGEQYEWLDRALSESTAVWKIVCHHHAPYSSDEDDYGNSWEGSSNLGDLNVRQIVELYERHGVDLCMFGHLHTHERTMPIKAGQVVQEGEGGVVYIQAGGGGGNLEDFAPTRSQFSSKTYRGHHYCIFTINGRRLEMRMYDLDGDLRDLFSMEK